MWDNGEEEKVKIKAGELMNKRTRAERARLQLLSAEPENTGKALDMVRINEEVQDDATSALQEYEDLLTQLINNAEFVI